MNRSLPDWAIDLIRDGVSAAQMRRGGDRAVFQALVRTAASAVQRGWGVLEWEHLIREPQNRLGLQVRLDRRQRPRKPAAVQRTLTDAWDRAVVWVSEQQPAWSGEQARAEAQERATAALTLAGDADADLTDSERAVLAYAAREHARRGFLQVTLPRAVVVEQTGLGERAVRTALQRLGQRGLLTLTTPGRAGPERAPATPGKAAPPGRGRLAAIYALADTATLAHYLCRGTRPIGPPAQTYGTPSAEAFGTPAQTYGTPPDSTHPTTTGEPTMSADQITLTLSPDERAAVLQTLAAMRAAATPEAAPLGGNVVPLRAVNGGTR